MHVMYPPVGTLICVLRAREEEKNNNKEKTVGNRHFAPFFFVPPRSIFQLLLQLFPKAIAVLLNHFSFSRIEFQDTAAAATTSSSAVNCLIVSPILQSSSTLSLPQFLR